MAGGGDQALKLKEKISSTVNRLKDDEAQKLLYEDVGATSLNHALSATLVKTLKVIQESVGGLLEGDQQAALNTAVQESVTINKAVSLQSHFREMRISGNLKIPEVKDLLVIPHADPAEGETKVNESAAKAITPFDAIIFKDPNQQDLACEQFLTKLYDLAKQLNLTHQATAALILRKLNPGTHLLVSHWLSQEGVQEATVQLPVLAGLLEDHFMRTSKSPRQANLSLQEFQMKLNCAEDYYEAAAKIARLAKLSVRDVRDDKERGLLETSKALEKYRSILNDEDREIVLREERSRTTLAQPQLSLLSMQQILAEKADHRKGRKKDTNSSFRVQLQEDEHYEDYEDTEDYDRESYEEEYGGDEYDENRVYWVNNKPGLRDRANMRGQQRNFNRGNQRGTRWPARGNYNAGNYNRGTYSRGNPNREMRFAQRGINKEGFRAPQVYQDRDNNTRGLRRQGEYNVEKYRGAQKTRGYKKKAFVTASMVNVRAEGCLKCDGEHRFTDTCCPYYERSPLMPRPCKNCGTGGHLHDACLNPKSHRKVNKALQELSQEEQEDNDYNEFLEGSITGHSEL